MKTLLRSRLQFQLWISIGAAVYANSFRGVFLFDDYEYIHQNPSIFRLWPITDVLTATSRPLVNITLALNYAWSQLEVWSYHAINVTIHLLAGLVLYGLVRCTLLTRVCHRDGPTASWLAFSTALIWMVHPLHTQSVTYIIQRAESLMGLFYLLTLYGLVRSSTSRTPRQWFAMAIACCALGMTSKPVMVTAPIAALLYDRAFLSSSFRTALRERVGLYCGLAATWALLGLCLTVGSHDWNRSVGLSFVNTSPLHYASTQPGILLHYLKLAIWPHPLCFHYDWPMVSSPAKAIPSILAVLALLGAALRSWKHSPPIGFLSCWTFLVLLPTSSVLPIITEVAAEHRMYLPLAGLVTLGIVAGWECLCFASPSNRIRRVVAIACVTLLTVVLGTMTTARNTDYHSKIAMWKSVIAQRPENPLAQNNIGVALKDVGRWDAAETVFRKALRLQPDYADAHINLGVVMAHRGDLAEAEAQFRRALTLRPDSAAAHYHLGVALGLRHDVQAAELRYRQAVALDANFADAHTNLGSLLLDRGALDEAVTHFQDALRVRPHSAGTHYNLAQALSVLGNSGAAAMHYREALRVNPTHIDAHLNLGVLFAESNQHDKAVQHFTEVLRLDPTNIPAKRNLQHALNVDS